MTFLWTAALESHASIALLRRGEGKTARALIGAERLRRGEGEAARALIGAEQLRRSLYITRRDPAKASFGH